TDQADAFHNQLANRRSTPGPADLPYGDGLLRKSQSIHANQCPDPRTITDQHHCHWVRKTRSGERSEHSTGLRAGILNYYQPSVDMLFFERNTAEAPMARADSGEKLNLANDSFNILTLADGSAKEHDIINSFFEQADAISTVKLLQLANEKHATNSA